MLLPVPYSTAAVAAGPVHRLCTLILAAGTGSDVQEALGLMHRHNVVESDSKDDEVKEVSEDGSEKTGQPCVTNHVHSQNEQDGQC